jgi:hypothetical protein
VINNGDSGINIQGWSERNNNIVAHNAILPRPGTPAIRPARVSGTIVGNVTCRRSCFSDALVPPYDLSPSPESPLLHAGSPDSKWKPREDFMGTLRKSAPDIGALERDLSGNRVGPKSLRPRRHGR